MSSISVLKRKRNNIKKKNYNKCKYKTTKTVIKNFKKLLILNKLDKNKVLNYLSKIFSMLDKLKNKKIIHCNKSFRLKSKLSILVNKYLAN